MTSWSAPNWEFTEKSLTPHQPAQEPDLSGVIDVMECHPVDMFEQFASSRRVDCSRDRNSQRAMLTLEEFAVGVPSRLAARFRAAEPVAALERE